MGLLTIKCPACATEGSFSLVDPDYEGPYKCWKCRTIFSIKIQGRQLISCQPLSEEEWQKQQEAEALKAKFKQQSSDKD